MGGWLQVSPCSHYSHTSYLRSAMMKNIPLVARMSLRTKMILSYLVVIVCTVIVLSIAIAWALQNYVHDTQVQEVQQAATEGAKALAQRYVLTGGSWQA